MESATVNRQMLAEQRLGTTLAGKYRLNSLLGLGTVKTVYAADNIWVGRPCAVSLFAYQGPMPELAATRFFQEARAANRIRVGETLHPNIIDVIDVGQDEGPGGVYYMVQELLEGLALDYYLYQKPGHRLQVPETLEIIRPVVDALAVAHEVGVVHRDLKPENIFLVARMGQKPLPKILDFGVAQMRDYRITSTGEHLGTPLYMAPESFVSGKRVDARADVWSLGVILHEMLTGERLFGSPEDNLLQVLYTISQKQPPPLSRFGISEALSQVVERCLAKERAYRYSDARHLLNALDRAMAFF